MRNLHKLPALVLITLLMGLAIISVPSFLSHYLGENPRIFQCKTVGVRGRSEISNNQNNSCPAENPESSITIVTNSYVTAFSSTCLPVKNLDLPFTLFSLASIKASLDRNRYRKTIVLRL